MDGHAIRFFSAGRPGLRPARTLSPGLPPAVRRRTIAGSFHACAHGLAHMNQPPEPAPPQRLYLTAAFYRFVSLPDAQAIRPRLQAECEAHGVQGVVLVAHEGINGTIAGAPQAVRHILAWLRADPRLAALEHKEAGGPQAPFYRMRVRFKPEIVTLGVAEVDPVNQAGTYVRPEDWNALIRDPEVVVIDTRNHYEVAIGSFQGALDPGTRSFRELPAWVDAHADALRGRKIAMFCTGGIRCEKSTALMRQRGFGEVYHLQGGILKYLETVSAEDSLWQGECFVFDERVAVGHGLRPGSHALCYGCRRPISASDMASALYQPGISCPHCHGRKPAERLQGLEERHRQVQLARARRQAHVGARLQRAATPIRADGTDRAPRA